MQKSKVKIIIGLFSLAISAFSIPALAQTVSEPVIKHFYASSQSRCYLGDADQDGVPDFAVGKAMEFEVSACDPELGIVGKVTFGDGGESSFTASTCNQRIVIHAYYKPQQDAVVLLDVKNEAGRSTIQAIKVDIVPLPPDEEDSGQPLAATNPPDQLAQASAPLSGLPADSAASPAVNQVLSQLPSDSTLVDNTIKPGAAINPTSATAQQAQASQNLTSSPLLGAFFTGLLALLFFIILIYAVRTFFNRS